jgi:DNA-binding NarL/FixJ family response regulator
MLENKCKIILVDDHALFREGLKLLIEKENIGEVIAEAGNGQEFLKLLEAMTPDVVLMDIEMPVLDGLQATEIALAEHPDLKVLVLSMYSDNKYYTSFLKLGVKGFVLKTSGKRELENAIRDVAEGDSHFSNELLRKIIVDISKPDHSKSNSYSINQLGTDLTKREVETLKYLCNGLSISEIADKMNLSVKSIEAYRSRLLLKTGTKNTINLILFSIKNKLISI